MYYPVAMHPQQRLSLPTCVALLACAAACDRAPPPSPPSPARAAAHTSPAPPIPTSSAAPSPVSPPPTSPTLASVAARIVYAGFGGTGPSAPPGKPNPMFTAAVVEVSSPGADLAGVHVVAITLVDATGRILTRAKGTIDVHVAVPGRGPYDFSVEETPFTGRLGRGASVLLRFDATLDTSREVLRAPAGTRSRVELAADGVGRVVVEAEAQEWPTG